MRTVPVVSTPLWRESWSIMRCRVFVLFMVLGFMAMAAPAGAQEGPSAGASKCTDFNSDQAAAQAYFEAGGGSATTNYEGMDEDGNGIACDEPGVFEGGGPSAGPEDGPSAHPSACADFTDQAAAQTYFDAQGADYQNLDPDDNGIACDEADASDSESASADSTGDADSVVSGLPVTGGGSMTETKSETNAVATALIGVATLLAGCAVMAIRRMAIGR